MPTIEITDEQYKAYQTGEPITVTKPKWIPQDGDWYVNYIGEVV